MSATDDVARILALVPWLLSRPGATVRAAAEAFGVTDEVLRGDLVHLDFCGLPGFRGGDLFEVDLVGNRIHLRMADELRRPLRLGPAESVRMVLLMETAVRMLDDDLPALRGGLAKVRLAAGVPASVTVDVAESGADLAAGLRDATRRHRRVQFTYRGRGDDAPRSRVVDPWGVLVENGRLYVQGHDVEADGPRSFRLDRISDLQVLSTRATHAKAGDLRSPRYEPHAGDTVVELRLEPQARWVAEVLEAGELREQRSGVTVVTISTDAPGWLREVVLQASGGARILKPASFRKEMGAIVATALARYGHVGAADGHPDAAE